VRSRLPAAFTKSNKCFYVLYISSFRIDRVKYSTYLAELLS